LPGSAKANLPNGRLQYITGMILQINVPVKRPNKKVPPADELDLMLLSKIYWEG
jgi:hypothetical protein